MKVTRQFRTIETAKRLENWSLLEVRPIIRFLWAKNVSTSEIHGPIVEVYGEEAMRSQHVVKLCCSFQSGRKDVENRNMAGSGRLSSSQQKYIVAPVQMGNLESLPIQPRFDIQ